MHLKAAPKIAGLASILTDSLFGRNAARCHTRSQLPWTLRQSCQTVKQGSALTAVRLVSSKSKPSSTTQSAQKRLASDSGPPKNEAIKAPSILVISGTGEVLGIKTLAQAMQLFDREKFDLVLVSPNQNPPVCRILEKKSLHEQRKKQQEHAAKQSRQSAFKEIEVNSTISAHDLEIKLGKAQDLLERGNRLQLTVFERGNQQSPIVFKTFVERLRDHGKMANAPTAANRRISVLLNPKHDSN